MMQQSSHRLYAAPRRALVGLILLTILVVLLVAAIVGWLAWQFSLLPPAVAGVLRIAIFATPLLLLASAGVVALGIAWRRWASVELLKADRVVELARAQAQRFPAGLQHLSFHDSSRPQLAAPLEGTHPPLELAPPTVPTFAQLLDQGKVGANQPLMLGFRADDGKPIEGGWDALYSCGIGALQGAGKSWLAAFLLAQSAAQGGRLIICDMHAGNPESLATRITALAPAFMCDVASTPDSILVALKLAGDKLEQRKAGKGGQWPIIVAVDEWTSLLRTKVGDVLPAYLEDFAEQGRKFNVNALLSAQGWTKDTAGVVRNRLTSHYVLRQRPDEARYQLGLPASACPLDVRLLPDAAGYLLDVRGNLTKVQIPQMTSADLERVGRMIDRPVAALGQPFGFSPATRSVTPSAQVVAEHRLESSQNVAGASAATTASGPAMVAAPEAARAAALFVAGSSPAEIVRELRGVGSKEGSRYQAALHEVLDLIRAGVRGG